MQRSSRKKEFSFFDLFDQFISDSKRGKRLQPNGKRISEGTIDNYLYTKRLLQKFCDEKRFVLRLRQERYLKQREMTQEKKYWNKFYKSYTDYLYGDCKFFDNYVGQNIKNLKAFFNYLNKDLSLGVGQFHKQFYVRKEEIAIFPLMPEELNFLIYDEKFQCSLSTRMKEVKDVFVFGCTVALRVSDLLKLKKSNVRVISGTSYLSVRSEKTSTPTLIKLPGYAAAILAKYKSKNMLLPGFTKSGLNDGIKKLLELAGFTGEVLVQRERRGKATSLKTVDGTKTFRFCDVASTHTMRRTAITTMLCLGMSEQLVRKISGHSPNTKEFYRYVLWAQTYQDEETVKVFERLKEKKLAIAG